MRLARPPAQWLGLGAILVGGALLRFVSISGQSYWYDESVTVSLLRGSFTGMLHAIARSESTPPLYYVLAWPWAHLFGSGEAGLRSLSALAGVAAVALTWAAVRTLAPRGPAALIAGALVAFNPMLVWYAQEARAYSLLVALGAAATWLAARVLRDGRRRDLIWWAIVGALTLTTHYFGAFVVAGQVVVLLVSAPGRRRAVMLATALPALAGLALLPLAHHQEADGRTAWIAGSSLTGRIDDVLRELGTFSTSLVSSNSPAPHSVWRWVALATLPVAAAGLVRAARDERRAAAAFAAIGGLAVAIPIVLAWGHQDFFKDRNLIAAWPPLAAAMGCALGALRIRTLGLVAAAAVCAGGAVVTVRVASEGSLQRQDWRGVSRALGPAQLSRAVIVEPGYSVTPLQVYGHHLARARPGIAVREIAIVGDLHVPAGQTPPGPAGFGVVQDTTVQQLRLLRYRSLRFLRLTATQLAAAQGRVLYEPGRATVRWLAAFARTTAMLERFASSRSSPAGDGAAPHSEDAVLDAVPRDLPSAGAQRARLRRAQAAADALHFARTPADVSAARRALSMALRPLR